MRVLRAGVFAVWGVYRVQGFARVCGVYRAKGLEGKGSSNGKAQRSDIKYSGKIFHIHYLASVGIYTAYRSTF